MGLSNLHARIPAGCLPYKARGNQVSISVWFKPLDTGTSNNNYYTLFCHGRHYNSTDNRGLLVQ